MDESQLPPLTYPAPIIRTDQQLIDLCDRGVRRRRRTELAIIHRTIKELTKAGYTLVFSDGEEDYENQTEQEGVNTIVSCDEGHIYTSKKGQPDSFVFFVLGNDGPDVINDYGVSLEPTMKIVNDWTDKQVDSGRF